MPEIDTSKSTVIKLAHTESSKRCAVCAMVRTLEFYDMDLDNASVCTSCMAHLDSAQKVLQKWGMTPPSRVIRTNNIERFK